jgi:hypothetical protein
MSKMDIKQYLEKIYGVDVLGVKVGLLKGEPEIYFRKYFKITVVLLGRCDIVVVHKGTHLKTVILYKVCFFCGASRTGFSINKIENLLLYFIFSLGHQNHFHLFIARILFASDKDCYTRVSFLNDTNVDVLCKK